MNAAQEMNDHRARGRLLQQAFTHNIVSNQQTQAGSRIGFQQEQQRISLLGHLLHA